MVVGEKNGRHALASFRFHPISCGFAGACTFAHTLSALNATATSPISAPAAESYTPNIVPAMGSQMSASSSMGQYTGGDPGPAPGRRPCPPGVNTIAASESVAETPRMTYASTPSARRNPSSNSACSSESPAHMSRNSTRWSRCPCPGEG